MSEPNSGKDFLGRGWSFPISLEAKTGRIASVAYEEDIKQSLHILLSTAKGERVMRPDFGCGIHELVFRAISTGLIAQIKHAVTEAIRKYEARVELINVQIDASQAVNGKLFIEIDYQIRSTNQSGNYVFPFYFKEAF